MRTEDSRVLAAAGIAAPVVWAGAVIYGGASRPGYNPVTQFVSELAERGSPAELLMRITGFGLPGLLVLIFAALLVVRSAGWLVAGLLIIHGVGRITAGVFPCDAGCPVISTSTSQAVHNAAAILNGLTLLAAALACSYRSWKLGRNRLALYSLVSAIGGTMFLVLMVLDRTTRNHVGLFQRLSFGIMHLWLAVFAASLWPSTIAVTDRSVDAAGAT